MLPPKVEPLVYIKNAALQIKILQAQILAVLDTSGLTIEEVNTAVGDPNFLKETPDHE